MYSILVCDDDKEIVEAIEIYLTQEDAGDGNGASFDSGCYDAASGRDQGDFEDP